MVGLLATKQEVTGGEDPYEFVCAILSHDRKTVELKGVKPDRRLPFVAMRTDVTNRLCELGVEKVFWIRKYRGRSRAVQMNLRRQSLAREGADRRR